MGSYHRNCRECGVAIQLRQMPNRQWVAFEDYDKPHNCKNATRAGSVTSGEPKKTKHKSAGANKNADRSSANRPHFREGAESLESLVEANPRDRRLLSEIAGELKFRRTAAATRLGKKVAGLLAGAANPGETSAQKAVDLGTYRPSEGPEGLHEPGVAKSESPHQPTASTPPKKHPGVKGTYAPSSVSELPMNAGVFKPWLGAACFGRAETRLKHRGRLLEINHRNREFELEVSEIVAAEIKKRLLWTTLSFSLVSSPKTTIRLAGISRSEAARLAEYVFVVRYGKQVQAAFAEFKTLLQQRGYLNRQSVLEWANLYQREADSIGSLDELLNEPTDLVLEWAQLVKQWPDRVDRRNDEYVQAKSKEWNGYFQKLEANPLTERQVEAILRDEDHALVVAGAGTGKTSTVIGKIGYLVESQEVGPQDILALAFARNAAEEMRTRVKEKTGHDVEIRTFHSLGFRIVADVEQEKPVVSDVAKDELAKHALIARLFSEMVGDEVTREALVGFVAHHRYPARYLEDFDHHGDYLRYMRKQEPRTLRGELVKSFEELLIADWLTLNSVAYAYEYPYEEKTANRKKRQYKPDFYLVESGIYLEHFGVNRNGETAPGIDAKRYGAGMEWKRKLHAEHSTTLIETYSWERMEGVLLDRLERKLNDAGVVTAPIGAEQIAELLEQRDVNKKLVALVGSFLNVFRESQWTFNELEGRVSRIPEEDQPRARAFLGLFKPFSERYVQWLSDRQEIDFSDLIQKATEYVEAGVSNVAFRRIVVDEYQDISRGRHRLLQSLLRATEGCRIMCVGDDWQSIFGFTGSDIDMTTNFEGVFGFSARVDLDRSFRFASPILESSARFIQNNPNQLKKRITAREHSIELTSPELGKPLDIRGLLERIESERPARKTWSVMLLGRYNHTEPEGWKSIADSFGQLEVEYRTIHKSKGLGADVVVVLDLVAGRYGFPGEIETDLLMGLVLPGEDEYPRAEERRVLYVAMTRAREKVFLLADASNPSEFVDELRGYPEIHLDPEAAIGGGGFACVECGRGRLEFVYPKRTKGYAWRCSLKPYCPGEARHCPVCQQAPLIRRPDMSALEKPVCAGNSDCESGGPLRPSTL